MSGSHATITSCASRCSIHAPCIRNNRKCALYTINATRLRQDHIPPFGRGVCRRHLRATHANGCISLEVRHLGERCTSCHKTGNGGRKGAASCSTRQPRCRSALSHASWPRRTKRTRCCSKHEPCFVSQRFDGDPDFLRDGCRVSHSGRSSTAPRSAGLSHSLLLFLPWCKLAPLSDPSKDPPRP